jgi:hypothetical protein
MRAAARDLSRLHRAQELFDERARDRADLVEVERARVGELEAPRTAPPLGDGRVFLSTEQVALEMLRRPRRAVDLDERVAASRRRLTRRASVSLPTPGSPEMRSGAPGGAAWPSAKSSSSRGVLRTVETVSAVAPKGDTSRFDIPWVGDEGQSVGDCPSMVNPVFTPAGAVL